jgi:predicted small lipoprotein YifL
MMPPVSEFDPVPKTTSPAVRLALVAAVLCLGLAACGRKGPLEPPPGAAEQAKPDNLSEKAETSTPGVKTLAPSISPVGSRRGKPITAPAETFILDPIL